MYNTNSVMVRNLTQSL